MEKFENLQEVCVSSRSVFEGRIMHVMEDAVRLPNGEITTREYMRHVGAVCIVPLSDDGCVLMERQFRYALGRVVTEIPAGKLDSKQEDRLAAAKRELREETGAEAESWVSLGLFHPACAYSDETIEMFLARGLSFGAQKLDADEFLNVEKIPLDALVDAVMDGSITDAKTQTAILKTKRYLEREQL